jgi:hypothetical protein
MSSQDISNIISAVAALAAVFTAITALKIAADAGKRAETIAAADRRESLRQAHLLFELEHLSRLAENNLRGGSTDRAESSRLGGEALMLIGLLGPERLPAQWGHAVGSDETIRAAFNDPDMPQHKKDAQETQLAVSAVLREIRESIARQ